MATPHMISLIIRSIDKVDLFLTKIEKTLICLVLGLMLGMASLQVILRNFFDSGIGWGDVFVRHLVLFLLFFGASLSTRDKRHIQMDISSKITPKKIKPYVGLLINAFCIVVNVYLFQASYIFVEGERTFHTMLFKGVPTWYFIVIMPIGFGIIAFRFFLNLLDNIFVILGYKQPAPEAHEIVT